MPSPTTVLLRTQSDDRLVALARSGHERAFEAIVERYRKPLLRACRRVLPEARAEDAVQQALVAAWSSLARGDEVRDLRPWLYRIAHNSALNQLRVSGYDHDELTGLLATGAAPEEELERRMVARNTLTGLAALPDRQREALLATAVQGRGQDEVARTMGISEPAVRQLVHRARTSLRTAATAITPMPLAGWLSELGTRSAPVTDRIGELVAGAGGVGGVGAAAKLSAVVVIASGAAAGGPAMVDRLEHGGHDRGANTTALGTAEARAAEAKPAAATTTPAATTRPLSLVTPAPASVRPHRTATKPSSVPAHGGTRSGSGAAGTTGERESDSSGSSPQRRHTGSDDHSDDSSGSGSGDDGGSSGSSGSGSSHDDSADAPEPVATVRPASTPEPDDHPVEPSDDHHGTASVPGDTSGSPQLPDDSSHD
jgi:RNA polymerase sigma factor (sigma-70 family)